jgi:hypothetical protein
LSSTTSTSKKKYRSQCDHLQRDRRVARLRDHAHRRDVVAAEDAHGRIAVAVAFRRAARAPLAVQEALHIRQEAHELVVVPLVEAAAVAGVFVDLLAPGRGVAHVAQHVPGPVVGVGFCVGSASASAAAATAAPA